jgi:SpoVK/Ycf46/Vps4 family AAA+-type ATPase
METIKPPPQGYRFHKSGSTSPIRPPTNSLSLSRSNSGVLARSNSVNSLSSDSKLHQIVRKIIAQTPSLLVGGKSSHQATRNATSAIVDIIYEKHREYRRKEKEGIVRAVDVCVAEILAESNSGDISTSANNSSGKKRRVAVGGGSDISDQPQTSVELGEEGEAKRRKSESYNRTEQASFFVIDRNNPFESTALPAGNVSGEEKDTSLGGMLNASLRNRYKEQREKEDHAAAAAAATSSASVEESKDESANEVNSPINTTRDKSQVSASGTTSTTNLNASTPNKKKKVKRTPSSKSTIHESNDPNPTITPSSTFILPSPRPTERYSTFGGISTLLTTIRQLIEYPLSHPELFTHLGIEPPRGVLLRGPPG